LAKQEYQGYLKSGHWQEIKAKFARSNSKRCFLCGETGILHLHHKTYDRLGHEKLGDLVYLCPKCHEFVHSLAVEEQNRMWDIKAKKKSKSKKKKKKKFLRIFK